VIQVVKYLELDTLGLVAIRDFLKKRVRYLRLVAQINKAQGVNVTPITVVASTYPELLVFYRLDQCRLTLSCVDDNSCLISE
jgi:hypothetical protein